MAGSTLYTRIVSADKDRGYVMLLSWDKPVVQRTAFQMSTMGTADQKNRDRIINTALAFYKVSNVVECTEPAMLKRLAKQFPEAEPAVAEEITEEKPVA